MRIVLLRHGKPKLRKWGITSSRGFSAWIEEYDAANVCNESLPSQATKTIADSCNSVLCSDLPRSIHSAKLIRPDVKVSVSELFRELDLPHGRGNIVKLKPSVWAVFFRILWFAGYSHNAASITKGRSRVKEAARELINEAESKQSVLLVGHGILNRMIAKELIHSGWNGPSTPKGGYWSATVYEKQFFKCG